MRNSYDFEFYFLDGIMNTPMPSINDVIMYKWVRNVDHNHGT